MEQGKIALSIIEAVSALDERKADLEKLNELLKTRLALLDEREGALDERETKRTRG